MTTFLIVLHVMVCILLIGVVLLQRGKGADMGAAFGGGGANTVFGSRGAGNFLTKITSACAAIFMLTSIALAYLNLHDEGDQIFDTDSQTSREAPSEAGVGGLEETGTEAARPAASDTLQEIPRPTPTATEPADDPDEKTDSATP